MSVSVVMILDTMHFPVLIDQLAFEAPFGLKFLKISIISGALLNALNTRGPTGMRTTGMRTASGACNSSLSTQYRYDADGLSCCV